MSGTDGSDLYENGKHRRYTLLFAVNGGTLAIAQYLAGDLKSNTAVTVAGNLTIGRLSFGMVIFSIIMVWDIYAFGSIMHKKNPNLFGLPGRMVLCLIGILISTGWLIAGSVIADRDGLLSLPLGVIAILTTIVGTWAAYESAMYFANGKRDRFWQSLSGIKGAATSVTSHTSVEPK